MKILLVLVVLLGMETAHAVPRILDADIVRGIKSVQNYVKNPEFETNIANVSDAGAGIITFSNVAPVDNTGSLVINSLLSGEIVKISTRAQQKKLEGQTCVAEFSYSGNATNYKAYVLNVAVNVSGDFPLSNAGAAAVHKLIPYPCQALNSTVDIAIESTAVTAGAIKLDSAFVGESEHALLPGFTAGSVLFSDGSKIIQDNANFFWDDASNRLGIGTATPSQALDVVGNFQVSGSAQATGVLRSLAGLELQDPGAGTNYVTIQSPNPLAGAYTLILPVDDGTVGQVLSTDGAGVLSWIAAATNTFLDNVFRIQDNGDPTKQLAYEVSGVTTATTRTVTAVDDDGYMALIDDAPPYSDGDMLYVDTATSDQKMIVLPIGTPGQFLKVSAGNLPVWSAGGGGASVFNCQDFTASGTYTATNTGFVYIEAIGGGGGSGYPQPVNAGAGAAGGAASFKMESTYAVTAASNYAVVIGTGGAGGNPGNGATGGNTSFDGVTLSIGGAGGGDYNSPVGGAGYLGVGSGGNGGAGRTNGGDSYGGLIAGGALGGGAGPTGTGGGGSSPYGVGGVGGGGPGDAPSTSYGAGGGSAGGTVLNFRGGNGADGFMRVCEVY